MSVLTDYYTNRTPKQVLEETVVDHKVIVLNPG